MEPITLDSAILGAKAMCDKANIGAPEYTVTPLGNPELSRLFAIDFTGGDDKTNILRASKAKECLRNKDGTWLELLVRTPTGENIKAYINVDKSRKVERTETLCKIPLKICATEFAKKSQPNLCHND